MISDAAGLTFFVGDPAALDMISNIGLNTGLLIFFADIPAVLVAKSADTWLTFVSDDLVLLFVFSDDPAVLVLISDADVLNFFPDDSAVLVM
jgi:hypothetical protein